MKQKESVIEAGESNNARPSFDQAYEQFVRGLQRSGASAEGQAEVGQAYNAYLRALENAWARDDFRRPIEQAYQRYVTILHDLLASGPVQAHTEEAFRGYLRAVRHAWQRVDIETLELEELASIGRSLLTVAVIVDAGRGKADARGTPRQMPGPGQHTTDRS